jgi:asparagine synthase (glutamine-hydrolysing)
MDFQAVPAMLAALNEVRHNDAVARYIDVDALAALVRDEVSEERLSERIRLGFAMKALTTARFLAWLDRSNR